MLIILDAKLVRIALILETLTNILLNAQAFAHIE